MNENLTTSLDDGSQDYFWIEKFQGGHDIAFEQIFNKYKILVLNLAFRVVRSKETAEDIAQEVFLKIYRNKMSFNPRKAKFSTWLYRITVNTALDFLRRQRRFMPLSLDDDIQDDHGRKRSMSESLADPKLLSPQDVLNDSERKVLVQKEIDDLPARLKLPLVLYQFKEMSYREIAAILKLSPKAVERRIYHAKELLKKKLQKHLFR